MCQTSHSCVSDESPLDQRQLGCPLKKHCLRALEVTTPTSAAGGSVCVGWLHLVALRSCLALCFFTFHAVPTGAPAEGSAGAQSVGSCAGRPEAALVALNEWKKESETKRMLCE